MCAAAFPKLISTQKWKGYSLGHLTYLCTDQIEKSRWMNDVLTSTLSQHSLTKSMEHKEIYFSLFAFSGCLSFILATVATSCILDKMCVCLILMEQNYLALSLSFTCSFPGKQSLWPSVYETFQSSSSV